MLIYPFFYVVLTVLYYDLRVRKEGFDLELLASSLRPVTDAAGRFAPRGPRFGLCRARIPLGRAARDLAPLRRWSIAQQWLLDVRETHPRSLSCSWPDWCSWSSRFPPRRLGFPADRAGRGAVPGPGRWPARARRDQAWYRREADRLAGVGRYAEAIQYDFLALVLGAGRGVAGPFPSQQASGGIHPRGTVDFRLAHFGWMTLMVEEDEPPNPADISLFSAQTVVTGANGLPHSIEQLCGLRFIGGSDASLAVRSSLSHKRQC